MRSDYLDQPNIFWSIYFDNFIKEISNWSKELFFMKIKHQSSFYEFQNTCKIEFEKSLQKANSGFLPLVLQTNLKQNLETKTEPVFIKRIDKKTCRKLMKNALMKTITIFNSKIQHTEEISLVIEFDNRELDFYYNPEETAHYVRYLKDKVLIIFIGVELAAKRMNFVFPYNFKNSHSRKGVHGFALCDLFENGSHYLKDYSICYDEKEEALYLVWGQAIDARDLSTTSKNEAIFKLDFGPFISCWEDETGKELSKGKLVTLPSKWIVINPYQTGKVLHNQGTSAVFFNRKIYVFGGSKENLNHQHNSFQIHIIDFQQVKNVYNLKTIRKEKYYLTGYRPYKNGLAFLVSDEKILVLGNTDKPKLIRDSDVTKKLTLFEFNTKTQTFTLFDAPATGLGKDWERLKAFTGPTMNLYKNSTSDEYFFLLLNVAITGRNRKISYPESLVENERKAAIVNQVNIIYNTKETAYKVNLLPKHRPIISCKFRDLVKCYPFYRDYSEGNLYFFDEKSFRIWTTDALGKTVMLVQLALPSTLHLNQLCLVDLDWATTRSVKLNHTYIQNEVLYLYLSSGAETNNEPIIYKIDKKEILENKNRKKMKIHFYATKQMCPNLVDRKDLIDIHKRSMIVDDNYIYMIGGHRNENFEEMQVSPEVIELLPNIPMNIRIDKEKPYNDICNIPKNIKQMNNPFLTQTSRFLLAFDKFLTIDNTCNEYKIYGELIKKDIIGDWVSFEIDFYSQDTSRNKLKTFIDEAGDRLKVIYSGLTKNLNNEEEYQMKMFIHSKDKKSKKIPMLKFKFFFEESNILKNDKKLFKIQASLESENVCTAQKDFCQQIPTDFSNSNPLFSRHLFGTGKKQLYF